MSVPRLLIFGPNERKLYVATVGKCSAAAILSCLVGLVTWGGCVVLGGIGWPLFTPLLI